MEEKKFCNFFFIFIVFHSNFFFQNVKSLDLSIDNRLSVSPSDCYTRISIGSRLADSLVISTIQIATVSDCEAACSTNGTSCSAFSFGVGAKGNGTCMFSRIVPNHPNNLQQDPDFDVYVKGHVSLIGCRNNQNTLFNYFSTTLTEFNRTRGDSMTNNTRGTSFFVNDNGNSGRIFGNLNISNVFGNTFFGRNKILNDEKNFSTSVVPEISDDDRTRIFDILQNKYDDKLHEDIDNVDKITDFNQFTTAPTLFDDDFVADVDESEEKIKNIDNIDELYSTKINPLKDTREFPIITKISDEQFDYSFVNTEANNYPIVSDFHLNFGQKINTPTDFEFDFNNYDNSWWNPRGQQSVLNYFADTDEHELSAIDFLNGNTVSRDTVIIVHDADCNDSCFRRIFAGKRIIDAYVRRVLECETLHDCHRMCEYERGFTCEGFNYRSSNVGKNICELTSVPANRVDINRDFTVDRRCQFYERDWSQGKCYQKKDKSSRPLSSYSPQSSNNWWAADPRPLSWNSPDRNRKNYGPVSEIIPKNSPLPPSSTHNVPYGGTFNGNTQLTLELPRPINSNRRYPTSGPFYNSDDTYSGSGLNTNQRPLPVRPLDTYPHHHNERPAIRPTTTDNFHHRDRVPQYGTKRPSYIPPSSSSFNGYSGNGYSYGRPVSSGWQNLSPSPSHSVKYPNKRIGYSPDSETNEIGPSYIPVDRRPPPRVGGDRDSYGYVDGYANNIGGGSKFPLSQRPVYPPRLPPLPSSSHSINEHHGYGQFYNYGNGYGYSYGPPALPPKINPPGASECSAVRSTSGFKLTRGIIHNSYLVTNVEQCEKLCEEQKNFICRTFAYRYSLASTSPFDNCLLSDAAFENLIFYTDLEPDRDYDIYALAENSKWCQTRTKIPNTRRPRPPDECFWRVRSGFCMPPSVIKKPIRVDGMGECQVQCVGSRDFTCRSFVYRYETYTTNGMPNCFLSDWPAMEVNPKDMQDMDGAELYERGSFGRGCESHQLNILQPPSYDLSLPSGGGDNRLPPTARPDDASCYADYDRPCRLTPNSITFATRVATEADCRRKCSNYRQKHMTPCMSFNFRIIDDNFNDNCYLSDISMRDLRLGLDYTHDQDYILYVWRESEPKCSLINEYFDNRQPNFHPLHHPFDPGHTSINGKPYVKSENPYYYEITVPEPNKPGLLPLDTNFHGNDNDNYDERYFFPTIPDELSVFRRFTVNGQPCKRGTKCEKNPVGGFWSCVPEGALTGDWDYCCEPNHHCGFSQGFNYQWCYVGSSIDQWRPCNDKYYPFQINPRPNRPSIDQPSYPRVENNEIHQSRHWPITFLHSEGPPNGTDSVALANDVTDESITNKSMEPTGSIEPTESIESITKIDFDNSSGPILNHTMKRDVDEPIVMVNKKRKNQLNVVPLKLINSTRRNRTSEKYARQRLNSRFKRPKLSRNTTINYSPRFLRDGNNNGQYYITKKLNARFPTRSNSGNANAKGNIATIERVMKMNDINNKSSGILEDDSITAASSIEPQSTTMKNIKLMDITPVLIDVFNETISLNITENNKND